MASYPGMRPMLQFTNLPPPPKERLRRRRKPVRTPEVPKVKSIPLAQGGAVTDDQENLPRPCLKWVSPQFCDDLTENGTHLKYHHPRLRKKKNETHQPLQEAKELFPNESDITIQLYPKSATRRNPLTFEQKFNQCFEQRDEMLRFRSAAWCSQEISMYPSTCTPLCSKLRSHESESSDESLTDEDDKDEHVRCSIQLNSGGCHVCPSLSTDQNVRLDANTHLDYGDDHIVPSASQQNKVDDAGIQLQLSTNTTQYTEMSNQSQVKYEQYEDKFEQTARPKLISNEDLSDMTSAYTTQSSYQKGEAAVHRPEGLPSSSSNPHASIKQNKDGHPSVENLSELIKDISMGNDNIDCNEHSIPSASADNLNSSQPDQKIQLNHPQSIYAPTCPFISTSTSCDRKLSRLEVTSFNPHLASTPFRDQHSPVSQISSQGYDRCMRSYKSSAVPRGEIRIDVIPRHHEEQEMSILVKETPEHLWCSPNFADVNKNRATGGSEASFRVSESIFQPAGSKTNHIDSNHPLPQHTSCTMSDIDMTTFDNFDNTNTSHTTMGNSYSNSTSLDMQCRCVDVTIPPTQDSIHSSEGEWSILVKQTPDELWCSPVVKVVDDSI